MKTKLLGLLLLTAASSAVQAQGAYIGGKLMNFDTTIKTGIGDFSSSPSGFAVFAGAEIAPSLALEATFLVNGNEDNIDQSAKLNIDNYYDFSAVAKARLSRQVEISGRVGIASLKWKDSLNYTASGTGPTVAGAASFYLSNQVRFFAEYQFLPDAEFDDNSGDTISSSAFNIGASVHF